MSIITNKIDSLPPLSSTVIELENFRKSPSKSPEELLKIIEKDPLTISTLLKVANSAMFAFRSKVETPARAISLLGVNFTISIAIGSSLRSVLSNDLEAYDIDMNDFIRYSNLISALVNIWMGLINKTLQDELAIPSFLQDIGKLIISDIAKTYGKSESFLKLVKSNQVDIEEIEKKMVGLSSSEITANMFKHWKLSETLINSIEFIDNIQECKDEYLEKTRILKIAKTACTINNPLDDKYIQKALDLAKEYGFDIEKLSKALDILQERLLDEKKD
ncbi:MAG: HDOD domain-containing protein [Arcobacteraceae bacterium]|jgi:HD-like signal output (HDOD) protein|nr:HDOD domain-containing protein [Arcobacteraceae bacterium]